MNATHPAAGNNHPQTALPKDGKTCLVTAVFATANQAQHALQALRLEELPSYDISADPGTMAGRKGGMVRAGEAKRPYSGLIIGLMFGLTTGLLISVGIVCLGNAVASMLQDADVVVALPGLLTRPLLSCVIGALIGLAAGGGVGGLLDYTMDRLGAEPLAPQETQIAVRCGEAHWSGIYACLSRAGARHLNVSRTAAM